jgi:tRNA1(Val) A37 N6-methylase TrmN6
MDVNLICSMFEELPQQGPGSDESTSLAFSFIPSPARKGTILDIGCGSGMQLWFLPDSVRIAALLQLMCISRFSMNSQSEQISQA